MDTRRWTIDGVEMDIEVFCAENMEGLGQDEIDQIRSMRAGDVHAIGGGAAPLFTIRCQSTRAKLFGHSGTGEVWQLPRTRATVDSTKVLTCRDCGAMLDYDDEESGRCRRCGCTKVTEVFVP